ncbi:MAG: zinc-binding dehydrogenase [Solibacillus sp.]
MKGWLFSGTNKPLELIEKEDPKATSDALEAVKVQGTVVIVGMGKLESNINTYLMITKEIKLLGSNGGSVEDLQGVYDCFAT